MKKLKAIIVLMLSQIWMFASNLPVNSIVKIYSAVSVSDYSFPWLSPTVQNYTGSGVIIDGNKILTSAHVVGGAKFIEVTKEDDPKKYVANLKYISNQVDLAILEVEDKSFFHGTKPLKINPNVHHRDSIVVLGYPIGGNTISATTGVISRIERTNYIWSQQNLLALQVDAAINPGNSGGPAIDHNGDIVGISMMIRKDASNIAYIVPSIIINTFLEDVKDNKVDGFYFDDTTTIAIENDHMKKYFAVLNGNGILVTFLDKNEHDLKVNDVIVSIDGKPLANNATIESQFGRVNYELLLHTKQIGQKIPLQVYRDKQLLNIDYTIKNENPLIKHEFNAEPRYIIFGGLVFSPITKNYLQTLGSGSAAIDMLFYSVKASDELTEPVVWIQPIFPHSVNRGYVSGAEVVKSVNGIKVKNFGHFVKILDELTSEYVVFEMLEHKKVVLNVKEARQSFEDLKKIYYLNADRRIK